MFRFIGLCAFIICAVVTDALATENLSFYKNYENLRGSNKGLTIQSTSYNEREHFISQCEVALEEQCVVYQDHAKEQRLKAQEWAEEKEEDIRSVEEDGKVTELIGFHEDGTPLYLSTQNSVASETIKSTAVRDEYQLSGNNVTLGVWDEAAVRATHQEFASNSVNQKDGRTSLSDHATHVAGTMIAVGTKERAKGMASGASVDAYDWSYDLSEMGRAGLKFSNHSYGYLRGWVGSKLWRGSKEHSDKEDYLFGFYDNASKNWDTVAYLSPTYVIVNAAGNDRGEGPSNGSPPQDGAPYGYDTIAHQGVSKNILTVGAVSAVSNSSDPSQIKMSSFSSWGPADDGRIKPDIVAQGVGLYSSIASSDSSYSTYSGTSMATPSVTGSMALLEEHRQKLDDSSVPYLSSTWKGLLIHTADEAGPSLGPDYSFGWGLANFKRAADLMQADKEEDFNFHIRELSLKEDETMEFPIYSKGQGPIKVTLCWIDPPGTPVNASLDPTDKMLVNDLDLRVIYEKGDAFSPWILDGQNPRNQAVRGDNITDNIEQVQVDQTVSGIYRVKISHKGKLKDGFQDISVMISGNTATPGLPEHLTISNRTIDREESFEASSSIMVGPSVTVTSSGDLHLQAGDVIEFNRGFETQDGSELEATLS